MRYKILTLNELSARGLDRLAPDRYEVGSEILHPDAILLRSASMHDFPLPPTLKAVGRAGAGVNNIPVERLSTLGVPVFNAPGANANAVKELVLAGILLAARNVCAAWEFTRALDGDDEALGRAVEAGKRRFVGFELPGRTLGVIGLGAIGVTVANAAHALGMHVVGYDPEITVSRAWQLSSGVSQASSVDDLLRRADVVTLHVPYGPATHGLVSADRIGLMTDGVTLLNFAREGIVDEAALLDGLDRGKVRTYVSDFPTARLLRHERVIALPHIGASTHEAEENCAVMVADQVREYLEDGNVQNSVNFPETVMPRNSGFRVAVVNRNVPNMLGQISTAIAEADLNIADMLNKSRAGLAYTLLDVDQPVPGPLLARLCSIDGVLSVRCL